MSSYRQILKSTSILGGASALTIAVSIVRTKIMALLLGPVGVGLAGIYDSIVNLANTIAECGATTSGVRHVAAVSATNNPEKLARMIVCIRRLMLTLAVVGTGAVMLLCRPISRLSFGHEGYANAVVILALAVFCGLVRGGPLIQMQGCRDFLSLARAQVIGAFLGFCISVPIVYCYGIQGIPFYMVAGAAIVWILPWWFARRLPLVPVLVSVTETIEESRRILRLGVVFLVSAMLSAGMLYALRVLIVRQLGEASVGQFHAAVTLSTIYVNFILQAMSMDFLPRLTAVAGEDRACNRMVNEQMEISLLLAVPGILTTLVFSPWVLQFFYSAKFATAADILQWQILGVPFQLVGWPMRYILVAKNRGRIFLVNEIFVTLVYFGLAWLNISAFGLVGAGIAGLENFIIQAMVAFVIVRRVSGFSFSIFNLRFLVISVMAAITVIFCQWWLPRIWGVTLGVAITLLLCSYCVRCLHNLIGNPQIAKLFAKFRSVLGGKF
ncbi:MAG: oligosaccharide flippase family protein [Verrucomicrobiota bacterium]